MFSDWRNFLEMKNSATYWDSSSLESSLSSEESTETDSPRSAVGWGRSQEIGPTLTSTPSSAPSPLNNTREKNLQFSDIKLYGVERSCRSTISSKTWRIVDLDFTDLTRLTGIDRLMLPDFRSKISFDFDFCRVMALVPFSREKNSPSAVSIRMKAWKSHIKLRFNFLRKFRGVRYTVTVLTIASRFKIEINCSKRDFSSIWVELKSSASESKYSIEPVHAPEPLDEAEDPEEQPGSELEEDW